MFQTPRARATRAALTLLAGALLSAAAQASTVGSFSLDNEVAVFSPLVISSAAGGTISASTSSYATGGFIPLLNLFDNSTGQLLQTFHTLSGTALDVSFSVSLGAGSYTLTLTQEDNVAAGPFLSDGFLYATGGALENDNYTLGYALGGSGTGYFWSAVDGMQRSGNWALDISVVDNPVGVPEPATLALALAALGGAAAARRRAA